MVPQRADIPGLGRAVFGLKDEIADIESREANLESKEPRDGLTFALAIGGGILGGGGIGTGGAVSLRLGHVATRSSVITFEITGTGKRHKKGVMDKALTDTNIGLFVGIDMLFNGWALVMLGLLAKKLPGAERTSPAV